MSISVKFSVYHNRAEESFHLIFGVAALLANYLLRHGRPWETE